MSIKCNISIFVQFSMENLKINCLLDIRILNSLKNIFTIDLCDFVYSDPPPPALSPVQQMSVKVRGGVTKVHNHGKAFLTILEHFENYAIFHF